MIAEPPDELRDVLDRVRGWPPPRRIALARRILETLDTPAGAEVPPTAGAAGRGRPVEEALGLLRADREPPDDAECRRIVEEARWTKYGS